jgi:hypothetical protein
MVQLLAIRDRIAALCACSEACTIGAAIREETGNTWQMLACIDRLVEMREIHLVDTRGHATQEWIIRRGPFHGRPAGQGEG